MAKSMGVGTVLATAMCDAIADAIDTGGGTAVLRIYGDTRALDVDTAVAAQTLLSEHNLANPAFGAAVDIGGSSRATANSISDDTSANATDTATWFRVFNRAGTPVIDGNVATSSADLIIDNTSITSGQTVKVNSYTITVAEVSP
tara:strand:+ start:16628 stop:17062 length:435 start_codon:yes stop_codon:yes gene_type:complete